VNRGASFIHKNTHNTPRGTGYPTVDDPIHVD